MGGVVGGGRGNGSWIDNSLLSLLLLLSCVFKAPEDSLRVYSDSGGVGSNLRFVSGNSVPDF